MNDALTNPFQLGPLLERLSPTARNATRIAVRRPQDHLVFDLLFDNLRIDVQPGSAARLLREDPARRAILIVEFPPQSFGEEAFMQTSPEKGVDGDVSKERHPRPGMPSGEPGPLSTVGKSRLISDESPPAALPAARIRMAGPSRLAFTMPADATELAFTLNAVLGAMREWPLQLDPHAHEDEAYGTQRRVHSSQASALRAALLGSVDAAQRAALSSELTSATRRIAEDAAGGLQAAALGGVGDAMWQALREESSALGVSHPVLREGDRRTAVLGVLALEAAASISRWADVVSFGRPGRQIADELPYLGLLEGQPHEPSASSTALELPYRLIVSPVGAARWQHALTPTTRQGRTELWHTRLGNPAPATGTEQAARLRALWSPDFDWAGSPLDQPFRMSLDAQDRQLLVKLMGEWNQRRADGRGSYLPQSSEARRLHLSALGALLDAGGDWDPRPEGVDLEQWRHLATLGRDHYVRVVYTGMLLPFGHAASLIKVTERQFENLSGEPGGRVAVLRQRFFIMVRKRLLTFRDDASPHEHGGRNFPFSSVEILTPVTPNLDEPGRLESATELYGPWPRDDPNPIQVTERMAFWPRTDHRDFRFEVMVTDRDGQRATFSLPMLFISEFVNQTVDALDIVKAAYNATSVTDPRVQAGLGGASLRFDAKPGDSRLSTHAMSFQVGALKTPSAVPATEPHFHPEMRQADVCVPALQKMLGRDEPMAMVYPMDVLDDSTKNAGEIYLIAAEDGQPLRFGGAAGTSQTDALGGLAAPQMHIIGLSKRSGPVSGPPKSKGSINPDALAAAFNNQFDPAAFFPKDATLIGGIALADVLSFTSLPALDGPEAPRLVTRYLPDSAPDRVESSFEWKTPVSSSRQAGLLIANADQWKAPTTLTLSGKTIMPLSPGQAVTREAHATLNNFKLNLFGFIVVWFDRLTFDSLPGKKPDVSVQLNADDAVMFGGALEFVNELRRFIPSNGFSDPPSLSVTPSGIASGYSLALPSVPMGIFDLSNVTLGAAFTLPFDNRPISLRFNFCERQRPFNLTVSAIGGGGFFALAIGANGVQEIEAALEFGAAVALNLVVASGIVEIKAGIYFHWLDDGTDKLVKLAGYVRIHGEVTVLAIASASITFNLQLGYVKDKANRRSIVYGEAELMVEIEVAFLSKSVAVHCSREFSGGPADPKFIDLIPNSSTWDDYCACFAPEAV